MRRPDLGKKTEKKRTIWKRKSAQRKSHLCVGEGQSEKESNYQRGPRIGQKLGSGPEGSLKKTSRSICQLTIQREKEATESR